MNFCRDTEKVVEPVKMNAVNTEAIEVLKTNGDKAFIEHVFTDPKDNTKKLSYAEMRMLYG